MALTKVITGVTDLNQAQSTNGLKFPTGNAFAGTPEEGMIRNDQTQASEGSASTMQFYNGTAWKNFVNVVPIISVNYLVSGGGGGGASGFGGIGGGGGGAGGLRSSYGNIAGTPSYVNETTLSLVAGTNYTVTVGGGSVGATSGEGTIGTNGSDSVFNTITSIGGGGARSYNAANTPSANGASGGGGSYNPNRYGGAVGSPITGTQGGNGSTSPSAYGGGGGGGSLDSGAGSGGGNGSGTNGGSGGTGLQINIDGNNYYYAGGGGGGATAGSSGFGGSGVGGNGGVNGVGYAATVNRGSGGGGGANNNAGAGGSSGVVILRYPNTQTITLGAGLTATTATIGTDKVTTFTAGTGTITFS